MGMYASISNQLDHFSRFVWAFFLLYFLFPRILFRRKDENELDFNVRNFIRMVFIYIVLGYALVLLKLHELLVLFTLFAFLFSRSYIKKNGLAGWEELISRIMIYIYDYADGIVHPRKKWEAWQKKRGEQLRASLQARVGSVAALGNTLLFLGIFVYAAWLRFYDAFHHAAPPMADSYVVLAWLKYLDKKILFHDEIYPQGFHINLDFLYKFSALDPLYVVKYAGPVFAILITLSMYFFVARLSGNKYAGLLTACIYGLLGAQLCEDWIRQAATNSQEFAFVFVLPALYFYYLFLKEKKMDDFWLAFLATCVAGLVHTLAFALLGLGMFMLLLTAFLTGPLRNWVFIWKVSLAGIGSVLVSVLPAGIGLLLGKTFYAASADFMTGKGKEIFLPDLKLFDYLGLAALGIVLIALLVNIIMKKDCRRELFVALFGIGSFLLYYYSSYTHSVVLTTRSSDLWALVSPVAVGFAWSELSRMIRLSRKKGLELILCSAVIISSVLYFKPAPIIPYKMEYDSSVEQYLRISTMRKPSDWLIISQIEEYSLAYGKGYHMMLDNFLAAYSPYNQKLVSYQNGTANIIKTRDVLIYQEKRVYKVDRRQAESVYELQAPVYAMREKEYTALNDWVEKYKSCHDNLSIFYEDDNIRIYYIDQPYSREDILNSIWGSS